MVENIALARALAKEVDIGKPVPTKWYQAVAEVLAMVYRLKKVGHSQASPSHLAVLLTTPVV
jgi:flagellar biosynthetic protein FlhB